MANEVNNALRSAAESVARYVDTVATLSVTTRVMDVKSVDGMEEKIKTAAHTVITLGGDSCVDLPTKLDDEGNPVIDQALFEIHERNVSTAIEYRAKMMQALLDTLKGASRA